MVDDGVRYVPYEVDGAVGEDIDLAAAGIAVLVVVMVFGLGVLVGWLVL